MERGAAPYSLSVVIPVYGSAPILPELVRQLDELLLDWPDLRGRFEVVLVDDCGPGGSWEVIEGLAADRRHLKAISLRKNAGQHNAIMAGLNFASGEVIVMMDDDLQHSPSDIPTLYARIVDGHDVCYADFHGRHHARWKILGSAINDRVARYLLKKPAGLYLSPFKAIRREVRDELVKYQGPHVYLDGLILTVTGRIASVQVEHHPRFRGQGGYSLYRSISLWLRMATNFSIAPLRLASYMGFSFAGVGLMLALYLVVQRLVNDNVPEGWTSLMVMLLILGGIQLMALGAIGEYLGRVFLAINRRPQFVVGTTLNLEACEPLAAISRPTPGERSNAL
jgi:glycosyltransferase involved in cell wall biosynthesis